MANLFDKMNSEDFVGRGFTVEDMLEVAVLSGKADVDAIELRGEILSPLNTFRIATVQSKARKMRSTTGKQRAATRRGYVFRFCPGRHPLVWGGGETPGRDIADYISLCRPLIREPGLINRWRSATPASRPAFRTIYASNLHEPVKGSFAWLSEAPEVGR